MTRRAKTKKKVEMAPMSSPSSLAVASAKAAGLVVFVAMMLVTAPVPGALASSAEAAAAPKQEEPAKQPVHGNPTAFDHAQAQVDWIRRKGGFFHDKLSFHQDVASSGAAGSSASSSSSSSVVRGVYVTADIPEGEILMSIPNECLLKSMWGTGYDCDTVRNLVRQRRLGAESEFAPYVNYLFDAAHAPGTPPLPSAYSDAGKRLLESVLGIEMPTSSTMTKKTWESQCAPEYEDEVDSELHDRAYHMWLRRNWEDVLIPVYDMVNHRMGSKWTNVEASSSHQDTDPVHVYATRDIEAGEQLLYPYNDCTDSRYSMELVLQHNLRDYGFVEQYPRRWMFRPFKRDLVYELDLNETTGKIEVTWLSKSRTVRKGERNKSPWGPPETWDEDEEVMKYLRAQLERLKGMSEDLYGGVAELESEHERDTIVEFYEAMVAALEEGIRSALEIQDAHGMGNLCHQNDDATCQPHYDDLEETVEVGQIASDTICDSQKSWRRYGNYYRADKFESAYQKFEYEHRYVIDPETGKETREIADTCLRIGGVVHVCQSLRPQYHDVLIHVPARYVDGEVKRVLYLGGGGKQLFIKMNTGRDYTAIL